MARHCHTTSQIVIYSFFSLFHWHSHFKMLACCVSFCNFQVNYCLDIQHIETSDFFLSCPDLCHLSKWASISTSMVKLRTAWTVLTVWLSLKGTTFTAFEEKHEQPDTWSSGIRYVKQSDITYRNLTHTDIHSSIVEMISNSEFCYVYWERILNRHMSKWGIIWVLSPNSIYDNSTIGCTCAERTELILLSWVLYFSPKVCALTCIWNYLW